MPLLFTTTHSSLSDFFKNISIHEIKDCFDSIIYYRGEEYYENGSVVEASFSIDQLRLNCIVKGNHDYQITIDFQNGEVSASCTCAFGGLCKHIVASLLYAINKSSTIDIVPDTNNLLIDIEKHLHTLSKSELVGLVKKFAPEEFWIETKNKFTDGLSAKILLQR